ncbi:MAG: NifU family protein [Bacteroidales bacterium]
MLTPEEIKIKVEALFESDIRPCMQEDGGDIEFVKYEEATRVLEVRMLGACASCPLAIMTLRAGIERLIIDAIPQIRRIENIK